MDGMTALFGITSVVLAWVTGWALIQMYRAQRERDRHEENYRLSYNEARDRFEETNVQYRHLQTEVIRLGPVIRDGWRRWNVSFMETPEVARLIDSQPAHLDSRRLFERSMGHDWLALSDTGHSEVNFEWHERPKPTEGWTPPRLVKLGLVEPLSPKPILRQAATMSAQRRHEKRQGRQGQVPRELRSRAS